MIPLSQDSLTARSVNAKVARNQQRYTSTLSTSYPYQAPKPPAPPVDARRPVPVDPVLPETPRQPLATPAPRSSGEAQAARHDIPTVQSLFELLRGAEPEPHDDDIPFPEVGRSSPDLRPAADPAAHYRLRNAVLGGTAALVLCGVAGGSTYYAWVHRGLVDTATGTPVVDSRAFPSPPPPFLKQGAAPPAQDAPAGVVSLHPVPQPPATTAPAPAAEDARGGAAAALATPADTAAPQPQPQPQPAAPANAAEMAQAPAPPDKAEVPQAATPVAASAGTSLVRAARPSPLVAPPSPEAKLTEAGKLASPAFAPVITVTASAVPSRGDASAAGAKALPAQPDAPGDAAALAPESSTQQLRAALAMVDQIALLARDMHEESATYRTEAAMLGSVSQVKASDMEQRLAKARSLISAAIDAGKEPAPPTGPDQGRVALSALRAVPVQAASAARSVRDYRIWRVSRNYAMLLDVSAHSDQGALHEVMKGDSLPGVGQVTAITVQGGKWVVQTDHGTIQ